jgi:hypothetical protein
MKTRIALAVSTLLLTLGLGAKDAYPGACVDCHGKERRISAAVSNWSKKVDAQTLARMQPLLPKGVALRGKHPAITTKDIPGTCIKCHHATSTTPAAFSKMMHVIHLTGARNEFVAKFGGDCRHCHKLNEANGTMSVPSSPEKP